MKFTWKLLPLVALLAVGLFALSNAPGGPSRVSATVDSVTGPAFITPGGATVNIVVDAEDDAGNLVITATDDGLGSPILDSVNCNPTNCLAADVTGEGTATVTIDTVDVDGDTNDTDMTVGLELTIDCDDGDVVTITANDTDSGSDSIDIPCGADLAITSVVITPSAASFACNSITGTVTVTVNGSGGVAIAGAAVTLTATGSGTILETMPQTTSAAGTVVFHYYAASTAQSVDFNATADNDATATAVVATKNTVSVTCTAGATATVPPAATTAAVVRAPSTGDGGLTGSNGGNWTIYAALLLTLGGLVGGVAVAKRIRA